MNRLNVSKKWILFSLMVPAVLLATASCAKKESDDLAKAQQCLDDVPVSDPTAADQCFTYAEKYTSQQANILKCSIKMTSGGLIETKVIKAYKALKDTTQANKTAAYMTALSLDLPTVDSGYTKAVQANEYCKSSGVPGLVYISSIIVAGSYMNKAIKDLTGNGIDITDPASMNTAVNTLLTACNANPPDAACTSDLNTLGQTVVTVANAYCSNTNADQSICASVNSAVDNSGQDPADVGQALFCYLQGHTFNTSTHVCN